MARINSAAPWRANWKGEGERTAKSIGTTASASGFPQSNSTKDGDPTAEMIWWLDDTESHYDEVGNLNYVYSHLSLGTPVARVDRRSNTNAKFELQFHGLGNDTLAAVQQDGTINASFDYAPFGEIIESTLMVPVHQQLGVEGHRRRMNDKFVDEVDNLAYYGRRYYDNVSMTWTQGDAMSRFSPDAAWVQPRRSNLYTMAMSNPLRYMDPDGMDSKSNIIVQVYSASLSSQHDWTVAAITNAVKDVWSPHGTLGSILGDKSVGAIVAGPSSTPGASKFGKSEVRVVLVNLNDSASRTQAGRQAPNAGQLIDQLDNNATQTARSSKIGAKVEVISIDRTEAAISRMLGHKGPPRDEHERAAVREYLRAQAAHEGGHSAGAADHPCGGGASCSSQVMSDQQVAPDLDSGYGFCLIHEVLVEQE